MKIGKKRIKKIVKKIPPKLGGIVVGSSSIQALTGADLLTLFNSLNLDYQIDNGLFYSLLATVQARVEAKREWVILRKSDATQSAGAGTTFATSFTVPDDFFFWQSEDAILLVDPSNTTNNISYLEVPFAKRFDYQSISYRFFCDYANSKLYLGGIVDRTYTIYKNYIYQPDKITATTSWVFPAKFHEFLAFGVAALYKLGVDFDDINKLSGDDNGRIFLEGLKNMELWDSRLAVGMLKGVDRRVGQELSGFVSGHINMYD